MQRRALAAAVASALLLPAGAASALVVPSDSSPNVGHVDPAPASLAQGVLQSPTFEPDGRVIDVYVVDERQGVVLSADLDVDGGTVPWGTRVNSHLVHFDPATAFPPTSVAAAVAFDGPILGIITTTPALVATDGLLGLPGLDYGAESGSLGTARGLDDGTVWPYVADVAAADDRVLTVELTETYLVDHVRVLTAADVGIRDRIAAIAADLDGLDTHRRVDVHVDRTVSLLAEAADPAAWDEDLPTDPVTLAKQLEKAARRLATAVGASPDPDTRTTTGDALDDLLGVTAELASVVLEGSAGGDPGHLAHAAAWMDRAGDHDADDPKDQARAAHDHRKAVEHALKAR